MMRRRYDMLPWTLLLIVVLTTAIVFVILVIAGALHAQTLTCTKDDHVRHCFNHQGYESTEERSRDYVHGHDNTGHAWIVWEHDGRTETWDTTR
jgi:hypothetical protein